MSNNMKQFKEKALAIFIIIAIVFAIFIIGYAKYWVWRAEHPTTSTWIFFIPSGHN